MSVRVRFAPSPTGVLHLGSARTALYNWLYARHHGEQGRYILRIEDTDRARSTSEAIDQALSVLTWLGLDWDEGPVVGGPHAPYLQSERGELYATRVRQLLESGKAYECFCSAEMLDAERETAVAAKQPYVYGGRCRELSGDERAQRRAQGIAPTVRLRVPQEGTTVVDDVIKGQTSFENGLIGDFIIQRSDGTSVYNFVVVVDDIEMQITHVVRGDDHLSNTPRQVLLYEALGAQPPIFAHAPMILGPDRKKLSKRQGHLAAFVEELAAQGYLPDAVLNYLALLGWSKDDETTVMSREELIEAFDIARVNKSSAVFDYDKLRWLNGQHLRRISAGAFAAAYDAWRRSWLQDGTDEHRRAFLVTGEQAAMLGQEKIDTFGDLPGLIGFLAEPFEISEPAWERLLAAPEAAAVLEAAVSALSDVDELTPPAVETCLRGLCERIGHKPRIVFAPIRFAITGQTVTPGLFESIATLGREQSLHRLTAAHRRLSEAASAVSG